MEHLTLSDLNYLIKESLELAFPEQVWVIAEIGELKVNRTGHCYLELVEKDENSDEISARSRATIWSWQFRFIQPYFETTTGQKLQAGLKVLVSVSIEFHEVYGISLNIKDIDPNYTLGDLARKRQEVINRLIEEGVFEMNKEIELADIPSRIAIISSPTAAGYEDFMNQLHHNDSGYKFYTKLFTATMQGNDAANSIVMALDQIYQLEEHFDAVAIIRGGGSQLDLNCFDQYELALNIAQFPLPVLTGIGHEKDESVADLVAHTQLKTPTAVAEFLIGMLDAVAEEINFVETKLGNIFNNYIQNERNRLNQALKLFRPIVRSKLEKTQQQLHHIGQNIHPLAKHLIEQEQFNLDKHSQQLIYSSQSILDKKLHHLKMMSGQTMHVVRMKNNNEKQKLQDFGLQAVRHTKHYFDSALNKLNWLKKANDLVDPAVILKRGFSITTKNGKALKDITSLTEGDIIETRLYKGKIQSTIKK